MHFRHFEPVLPAVAYPEMFTGEKSDRRNIGEGIVLEGSGRGGSPPLVKGVRGCNPGNFLTTEMLYASYSTYFVVKFMSLVVAFKIFIERKIWVKQHF